MESVISIVTVFNIYIMIGIYIYNNGLMIGNMKLEVANI